MLSKRAFTIIELLVVIGILVIFASYTVISVNSERGSRKVEKEAREFHAALQYARSLAVSGAVFQDEDGDTFLDSPNAYGVHLYKSGGAIIGASFEGTYSIFGDLYISGANETYDAGEVINFPPHVIDTDIGVYLAGALQNEPVDIVFDTQFGTISYRDNDGFENASSTQIVFFQRNDTDLQWLLTIFKDTGQIILEEPPVPISIL